MKALNLNEEKMQVANMHDVLTMHEKRNNEATFRKAPIEWVVQNQDEIGIGELLSQEKNLHENVEDGLSCLRKNLSNDEKLKSTVKQFSGLYKKANNVIIFLGLLSILPILSSIFYFFVDLFSDINLTHEYHNRSSLVNATSRNESYVLEGFPDMCRNATLTPTNDNVTFHDNLVCHIIQS